MSKIKVTEVYIGVGFADLSDGRGHVYAPARFGVMARTLLNKGYGVIADVDDETGDIIDVYPQD